MSANQRPVKLLIERLDHTGDCVETIPVLVDQVRKRSDNGTVIDLLVTSANKPLVETYPGVRRVIAFDPPWSVPPAGLRHTPRRQYLTRSLKWSKLAWQERLWQYDYVFFLSFSPWILCYFALFPVRRIGFGSPYQGARHKFRTRLLHKAVPFDPCMHIRANCLRMLTDVWGTAPIDETPLPLRLSGCRQLDAETVLSRLGLASGNFVLVHPGGPDSFKSWPHKRFLDVAEALADEMDVIIALAPGALAKTDRLFDRSPHWRIRYLAPQSFAELGAVMARASLFIGNDGGPAHLAAALGIPTVAVFGPTDERVFGPRGCAKVRVIAERQCNSPCCYPWSMAPCSSPCPCLANLSPDKVLRAARELI